MNRKHAHFLFFAAGLILLSREGGAQSEQEADGGTLAFTHGTVIDTIGGRTREGMTVLIEGERIVGVFAAQQG